MPRIQGRKRDFKSFHSLIRLSHKRVVTHEVLVHVMCCNRGMVPVEERGWHFWRRWHLNWPWTGSAVKMVARLF